MSEEEKDILVTKRKYWTKLINYNFAGTIFLVIFRMLFHSEIGLFPRLQGLSQNLILVVSSIGVVFIIVAWPLSFIMYGYQSFKIYKINRKESLEQRQQQHEAKLEHIENKKIETKKKQAMKREEALDYDSAIRIWEELGEINEAARVRKLKSEQGSVKVAQKVVHGDEVTKTEIKDSVLNRSNVGGGSSKMQELKDLTEMKKEGLIDDDEFKQMKKEILGK
jgi:hypothetical protein